MVVLDLLLKIGIILFMGMIGGKLAERFKLPNVSGYIVGGLIIGPSLLNIIKAGETDTFSMLNDFALATIAFSIGSEFLWEHIKKIGKNIMIITFMQVVGTMALVFAAMFLVFNQDFGFSLIASSIAAATAPAGIVLVIRELKAKGPLVDTILPVIAIDDAMGLMAFGISLSVVKLINTGAEFSFIKMISSPIIEIVGSLFLGAILGFILSYLSKKTKGRDELLSLVIGFIILGASLSNLFGVSPLLTSMVMGAMIVNLVQNSNRVFSLVDNITPPIYVLFFTLAGASLDISVLSKVGLLGVGYIVARTIGKILGAGLGAKIVDAPSNVVKYLGMTLLPSGGIPIGLALIVANELPSIGEKVTTIVLFSILIFDIVGPILTRMGIIRSGEKDGALKNN